MNRWLLGAGLLLSFVVVSSQPVAGQNKKKVDDKPAPTTDADTLPPGQFTGKLKTVPGSDGSMIVSVEYQHLQLKNPNQIPKTNNPQLQNVIKDQAKIAQLQQKIATARTARQQLQYMQQLQTAMTAAQLHLALVPPQQSPYIVKTDSKDITFHAAEEMKVRFNQPPSAFDDKGNPKKYTADELKELKGEGADAKLVGYAGSVEKLTAGMPVRVTTIANKPKKPEKKPDDAKPDEKKPDEKKPDEKKPDEKKPDEKKADANPDEKKDPGPKTVVSLLLVLGDDSSGTSDDSSNPKKKMN